DVQCHKATCAPQQRASLLDHLVGDCEQARRKRHTASRFTAGRIRVLALDPMPRAAGAIRQLELSLRAVHPLQHAAMHLQIVEAGDQLTLRYVANGPHRQAMWIGLTESRSAGGTEQTQYHSRRYWIDGRRIRAAPKAPQRKRPCRSRALSVDPSCSFVRCDQPSYAAGFSAV